MQKGIVVATDIAQEWLLPWWWKNYTQWNSYPVAFFDFGMSQKMQNLCKTLGTLHTLSLNPLFVKEEIDLTLAQKWEMQWGPHLWNVRHAWFKKPFACLNSPFDKTIWIDLDCEIKGTLAPLFDLPKFAIAKDQICNTYNSGVIFFPKQDPLIKEWAQLSLEKNTIFPGDQDLLTWIVENQKFSIYELSQNYNWNIGFGDNSQAIIYHWLGANAKQALRSQIALSDL